MLGLSNVTSSAYPKLPIYLPWIWHPIPDFFNLNKSRSMYIVNILGEITPPCFTPLVILKNEDFCWSHTVHAC